MNVKTSAQILTDLARVPPFSNYSQPPDPRRTECKHARVDEQRAKSTWVSVKLDGIIDPIDKSFIDSSRRKWNTPCTQSIVGVGSDRTAEARSAKAAKRDADMPFFPLATATVAASIRADDMIRRLDNGQSQQGDSIQSKWRSFRKSQRRK